MATVEAPATEGTFGTLVFHNGAFRIAGILFLAHCLRPLSVDTPWAVGLLCLSCF